MIPNSGSIIQLKYLLIQEQHLNMNNSDDIGNMSKASTDYLNSYATRKNALLKYSKMTSRNKDQFSTNDKLCKYCKNNMR